MDFVMHRSVLVIILCGESIQERLLKWKCPEIPFSYKKKLLQFILTSSSWFRTHGPRYMFHIQWQITGLSEPHIHLRNSIFMDEKSIFFPVHVLWIVFVITEEDIYRLGVIKQWHTEYTATPIFEQKNLLYLIIEFWGIYSLRLFERITFRIFFLRNSTLDRQKINLICMWKINDWNGL